MKISGSYMVVRMKSMNRMKAVRRITALIMLALIIFCFAVTGFDMGVIIRRGNQAVLFIKRMFPPDTAYCGKIIEPLIKTVQMSVAGTFIGAVLGLFTAFLYADNIIKKPYVRIVVRVIVQCVRTIPVLILALVATFIWGLGAAAGTIAIAVSTWAVMSRIGGEFVTVFSMNFRKIFCNVQKYLLQRNTTSLIKYLHLMIPRSL